MLGNVSQWCTYCATSPGRRSESN
ncbi:MAG: hypothetical protein U1D55_00395 [Phycisphaerae bacterium]